MIKNRKNELAIINAGVCNESSTLHYYRGRDNAVGGIYEFSAPSFRKQWWDSIPIDDPAVKTIECNTLDFLLKEHTNVTFFYFLSLDVEGAELSVLESIDFERVGFGIVLAEANSFFMHKHLALREFLEEKGYEFFQEYERSYWWVNRDFYRIYKGKLY